MKKRIVVFCLVLLISVNLAYSEIIDEDKIVVSENIEKGWNLISNGAFATYLIDSNSEIEKDDLIIIYYYEPTENKFFEIYPKDRNDFLKNKNSNSFATWIYSSKKGKLIFSTEGIVPVNQRILYKGWNLVSLTPSLVENSENTEQGLKDIKGNCKFERVYLYDSEAQSWLNFDYPEIDSSLVGQGLAIRVSKDCHLGSPEEGDYRLPSGKPEDFFIIEKDLKELKFTGTFLNLQEPCKLSQTEDKCELYVGRYKTTKNEEMDVAIELYEELSLEEFKQELERTYGNNLRNEDYLNQDYYFVSEETNAALFWYSDHKFISITTRELSENNLRSLKSLLGFYLPKYPSELKL